MLTKHMILEPTDTNIQKAAQALRAGALIAFPTETVYGLGGHACDGVAVAKIFALKNRPQINPLITHGAGQDMLEDYAVFDERARALAAQFWPGPLSFILPLKDKSGISELVTAGLPTIGVRVPAHKVARDVIAALGAPVAAPSANISGRLSPTAAHHVIEEFGDKISCVLAGGVADVGLESTILDLTTRAPVILRPGAVTAEDIELILNEKISYEDHTTSTPKSPGQLLRHYAPRKKLRLHAVDVDENEALLAFGSTRFMAGRHGGAVKDFPKERVRNLSEAGDLYEAAAHLFGYLRALDQSSYTSIAVMDIPNKGVGIAINDRLRRAAKSQES